MSDLEVLREIVGRNRFVILDTETTGMEWRAEICQIAIIDQAGHSLLDTLVKPTIPIPPDVTAIHGITDERVTAAPTFDQVWPRVLEALRERDLIVYSLSYDIGRLESSLRPYGLSPQGVLMTPGCHMVCAMSAYAEYWGDWNEYYQSYTWKKLTTACAQQKLPVIDAHNALGDCRMTLALIRKICAESEDWLMEG